MLGIDQEHRESQSGRSNETGRRVDQQETTSVIWGGGQTHRGHFSSVGKLGSLPQFEKQRCDMIGLIFFKKILLATVLNIDQRRTRVEATNQVRGHCKNPSRAKSSLHKPNPNFFQTFTSRVGFQQTAVKEMLATYVPPPRSRLSKNVLAPAYMVYQLRC